jgi:hypothetical protein
MRKPILVCALATMMIGPLLGAAARLSVEAKAAELLQKGTAVGRLAAAEQSMELASSRQGPIVLGSGPTRIVLSAASTAAGAVGRRLKMLRPTDQVYLILKGIETALPSGTTYNVFIGLPEALRSASPRDPQYVGTFGFFNAGNAVFNVTEKIKAYVENSLVNDHPVITIVPAGETEADAKPVINQVTLVVTDG